MNNSLDTFRPVHLDGRPARRPARANRATDTRTRRPCHYRLKTRPQESTSKHIPAGGRRPPPAARWLYQEGARAARLDTFARRAVNSPSGEVGSPANVKHGKPA